MEETVVTIKLTETELTTMIDSLNYTIDTTKYWRNRPNELNSTFEILRKDLKEVQVWIEGEKNEKTIDKKMDKDSTANPKEEYIEKINGPQACETCDD